MSHLFMDTNVLIDFLADREPFSMEAAKLFNYSENKQVKIYVSAVSFNNIYYILRQASYSHVSTLNMLSELREWTAIVDVNDAIIDKSLKSDFKDFEDAIQYHCAKSVSKIAYIVTRNTKDYKFSSLPVLTPKEAVALLESSSK